MQNPTILFRVYIYILVFVFAAIVFHAPLTVWVGMMLPEYDIYAKAWKEILLVLLFPVAIFLAHQQGNLKELLKDKLLFLIGVYALLHFALLLVFPLPFLAVVSGLMIDLRYLLFFVLIYVGLKLVPSYAWKFLWAGIGAAVLSLLFALLQVFMLPPDFLKVLGYGRDTIATHLYVDNNPEFVRINGTLRGPNPLGAYALMVLSLLSTYLLSGMMKVKSWANIGLVGFLAAGGVVAVWASYSRSALVAAIASIGLVIVVLYAKKIPFKIWGTAAILGLFLVSGAVYMARDSYFVQHVIFHEDPQGLSEVSSNEEHVESLQIGTERMLAQPLGAGVGSTGSASLYTDEPLIIENQYLFIAHESGWPGLVLFIAIMSIILWRLWRAPRHWLNVGVFASGVGLAAIGLLQPVWVDDTVSLVWWGLAAIALAVPNIAQVGKNTVHYKHERHATK